MKNLVQVKIHYEIKEKIGGGLTSEVYRAYRTDHEGLTKQEVALKILNSKKDIQIFKLEFEKMLKIYSKYCARVLAWEIVNDKRTLVLEYVSGLTLKELLKLNYLTKEESLEILSQVKQGLLDLHSQEISHGDLNLTNIMVNQSGIIKLIDFGSEDPISGGQLMTADFASPRRLSGESAIAEDDFYSFNKLANILLDEPINFDKIPNSKAGLRRSLSKKIKNSQLRQKTQYIVQKLSVKKNRLIKVLLPTITFLSFLLIGSFSTSSPKLVNIKFQSNKWYSYSVNDMPKKYGPIEKLTLRRGHYQFLIEDKNGFQSFNEKLLKDRTFLLQPVH